MTKLMDNKELEINNILVILSECIETTNDDDLLQKLYEFKHWLIDELQTI